MIYTNIDNFYVGKEELESSPSHRAGVESGVVMQLRTYGCELIQEGGCLLKLPQVVMATGQVLFHRFYCKQSMTEYDVKDVATTCCWLASKLEETKRRVRDVLAVFHRIHRRREGRSLEPLDVYSKHYETLKAELIRIERIMLRSFGFIVHVEHPHKLVLNHLHLLGGGNTLMQEAWSLANDSLRTTLCVRLKSEAVACGIIFVAARRLQIPLPEDPPWWELHNVSWGEVVEVACEVQALYQRPKAKYVAVGRLAAGATPPGALPTPMASPATAQGTPAASRQGGGSGGALQNGDSAHLGGGGSSGAREPGGSGEARDERDGAPAQAASGGSAERVGESGRSREGDSERAQPRPRNGERGKEGERERSHGTAQRRDKPREGHEHGARERDAREREARGSRDRKRDRPDRERRGDERRGDSRRPERAPSEKVLSERAGSERGYGAEGERRRDWGGERERRRGSGEGLAPARPRSPERKRARSDAAEYRPRVSDSPRRDALLPPPPLPARGPREQGRGERREGSRSGSAGPDAARGNGALPGVGARELPPPPPLAGGLSPDLEGSSGPPPRRDEGDRGARQAAGERARHETWEEPLPRVQPGIVQSGAHAKVGLLRVGGRAADPAGSLRGDERERNTGASAARASLGEDRKASRHTPIPPFRRS